MNKLLYSKIFRYTWLVCFLFNLFFLLWAFAHLILPTSLLPEWLIVWIPAMSYIVLFLALPFSNLIAEFVGQDWWLGLVLLLIWHIFVAAFWAFVIHKVVTAIKNK